MGVRFEWYSNDASWAPTVPPRQDRSRRGLALRLGLLALAVAAGLVLWRREAGLRALRADLQRQVDLTIFALRAGDEAAFLASFDSADTLWLDYQYASMEREAAWYRAHGWAHPRVASVQIEGDEASALVVWPTGDLGRCATWHFVRRDSAWRQKAPPDEWWGEIHEVEAHHVTLRVYAPDLESAALIAPELDRMIADLSARYPAANAEDQQLTLRVWPHGTLDNTSGPLAAPIIASPSSGLEIRTAAERQDDLRAGARLALAFAVLARARELSLPVEEHWWLLASLAAYYAGDPGNPALLANCLANGSYVQLLDMEAEGADPSDAPGQSLAAEQVRPLAYALGRLLVSRYGDRLGTLVATIGTGQTSWDAVQRVLGVSRAELEATWGSELAQAVRPSTSP